MRPNQTNYYAPGGGLGLNSLNRMADGIGQADSPLVVIREPSPLIYAWGGLGMLSSAVSAYHGFKRNKGSIGWTIAWALLGGMFPIIVPVVAFAQGYAKPAVTPNRRRRTSRRHR